jgi:homospermidine synthase
MTKHIKNILILGFGNIAQALSFSLRNRFKDSEIHVIDEKMNQAQVAVAQEFGFTHEKAHISKANHIEKLIERVSAGTLILNLATSIGSRDMIAWASEKGAFYLDTSIDPWEYQDGLVDSAENTNYELREQVLRLRDLQHASSKANQKFATAIVAHGANPGFASILVKQALLMMQRTHVGDAPTPRSQHEWGMLAKGFGIRAIQVSERDTQTSAKPASPGEFACTWSVDGYVAEALQPAELGWGTHEEAGPHAALVRRHETGCKAAAYYPNLGVFCDVKTWTPGSGEVTGNLISHNEAISLADYFTIHGDVGAGAIYRPTAYYAYHPCDQAVTSLELIKNGDRSQVLSTRILKDDIVSGVDELGVLLISDKHPSLWYGSQLSIDRARSISPHNNATSLQVVGSVMAALEWIEIHPEAGLIESDHLDHEFIFAHARHHWEPLVHEFRQWHPSGDVSNPSWTIDQFITIHQPKGHSSEDAFMQEIRTKDAILQAQDHGDDVTEASVPEAAGCDQNTD